VSAIVGKFLRVMNMSGKWIAMLFGMLGVVAWGQTTASSDTTFPRFTLAKGQQESGDGAPTSGAKLCIVGRQNICYQMQPEASSGSSKVIYEFGLEPRSERLPLAGGGSWVFFSAMFSAGGSGTLERLAVLRYSDGGRIINLLPFIGVSNLSDRAMWTVPGASTYPILVTADFIWSDGEVHFSPHYFTVQAWRFDQKSDQYVRAFSYQTTKKYDCDPVVRVLGPERQEILRRLMADREK
jgi:hypothetical protein